MAPLPFKLIDPIQAQNASIRHDSVPTVPWTSQYFLPFYVSTCEPSAGDVISNAIQEAIAQCATPGSKAQKAALQRHTNPYGNLYGMAFSRSEQDRLAIAVKFIEFLCILDGRYIFSY
jgi:hypothetical protein